MKTNIQVADGEEAMGESFVGAARELWETAGFWGFWDGLGPKLARAVVNHAVTFYVFDLICAMPMFAQ